MKFVVYFLIISSFSLVFLLLPVLFQTEKSEQNRNDFIAAFSSVATVFALLGVLSYAF